MKFLLVVLILAGGVVRADNWPHWRGPHDNGSTKTAGAFPTHWSTNNVLWQATLPGRGCSTPIVWEQCIVLTAPVDGKDAVLAFAWDGKPLWQTTLDNERPGKHRNGSGCNPSPVTDGESIFVYFKTRTLAALDWTGKIRWQTNLEPLFGKDTLFWDVGTSPVLTEQDVVVAVMHHGESGLAAYNKQTGKLHWTIARNYETPLEGDHSYATPLLIRDGDRSALLVLGGEHLTAHDVADGRLLWSCGDFNPKAKKNWVPVASPVVIGNMAIVSYGRGTNLHGVKLGGAGDVTATQRLWKREDVGSFCPTPAAWRGHVYVLTDRGIINCIDPATGQTVWNAKLPENNNHYYASPTIAGNCLYAAREDGVVYVARIANKFELLSEIPMADRLIASPVPVANRLLLRGEKHLFCIAVK